MSRLIPWEATGCLLLYFHSGSFTRKTTKFDLRTLILFIWRRKWGAEVREPPASGTTETKHRLGNHHPDTQRTLISPSMCMFCVQTCILCTCGTQVWQNVSKRQKEWGGGGRRKCYQSQHKSSTSVWTFCPGNGLEEIWCNLTRWLLLAPVLTLNNAPIHNQNQRYLLYLPKWLKWPCQI